MTRTVATADASTPRESASALSGERDADAGEYTVYPTCAGDDDLITTWLTRSTPTRSPTSTTGGERSQRTGTTLIL